MAGTAGAADLPGTAGAADVPGAADLSAAPGAGGDWSREISELFAPTSGGRVGGTVKIAILLSVLSLVPAILMMTTSFVRIITVLSILRQGLGTGQTPPTQVLTAIAVFMTLLVMTPTFTKIWDGAIRPYSDKQITFTEAVQRGEVPMRTFLWKQIERSGNTDVIYQLLEYVPNAQVPKYYEDIPWRVLLPAFMMSELKIAFLIGFQILLPFLIIDLIVSGVTVSMGMMMLPPALVSLPLKLMLFVLVDGWTLVVKALLDGFVVNI
ncbi:MAG: flagellar type III secretion system pore protein FliP [Thermoguttaceae bacterium]|nr:flagellar type III secretion system pore protein FliP [Thermoguttaceae bacterium]MBQ6620829.1 flagellar type III secretion system pore protein FliP [Thermoguttaceae bacterium]